MKPNIFDTETTGIPNWKVPSDDPSQPHLVEIAALLFDEQGTLLDSFEAIIKPDGWVIPLEVSNIHGITQEIAMDMGISEAEALEGFLAIHRRSDLRVAHNVAFDDRIIRIAIKRHHGDALANAFKTTPNYCTCRSSRSVVALPSNKLPSLGEAYKHFTGEDLYEAHRASTDAHACARIYFALQGVTMPGVTTKNLLSESPRG